MVSVKSQASCLRDGLRKLRSGTALDLHARELITTGLAITASGFTLLGDFNIYHWPAPRQRRDIVQGRQKIQMKVLE